jgi:hypothetical protein
MLKGTYAPSFFFLWAGPKCLGFFFFLKAFDFFPFQFRLIKIK